MYVIEPFKKNDPVLRWGLPDRVFFACGACHILAYAFLEKYNLPSFRPIWLKPSHGFAGNHIFAATDDWVFDYHGYSRRENFLAHTYAKANRTWPGWQATQIELPREVLISEEKSKTYEGLWLREPNQFLHDAMPRAIAFLERFPSPFV